MGKIRNLALTALILALSLALYSPVSGQRKLRVLTTFLPMYVFTVNVAGEAAEVENLLPPGATPHDYAFAPADVRKAARADVVVMNGVGGLDGWMEGVIKNAGRRDLKVIKASAGIKIIESGTELKVEVEGEEKHEEGEEHEHEGGNPHVWLDPTNAIQQVVNIRDGLIAADPENAAVYRRNSDSYIARLEKLDSEIMEAARSFKRKDFVAFHDGSAGIVEKTPVRTVSTEQ